MAPARTAFVVPFSDPGDIEDYFDDDLAADEFECLETNTCSNDGGHVWLGSPSLRPFCIYCGERAE